MFESWQTRVVELKFGYLAAFKFMHTYLPEILVVRLSSNGEHAASQPRSAVIMDKTLLASCRSSRRAIRQLCPSPKYVPARIVARRTSSTTASTLIFPEAPTKEHSNLATFLAYVERTGLNKKSTVYRGTHYEYTVAEALSQYGFVLKRVGGASDRGLDLLGTWKPPSTRHVMKVFLQCKAGARSPSPMFMRELKGARAEAPPGWRSDTDVLGLLVGEKPATRGVQEELRASVPLGYVCCSKDGELKQLLWNQAAQEMGLEGVTVAVKYAAEGDGLEKQLVLMKRARTLPLLEKLDSLEVERL